MKSFIVLTTILLVGVFLVSSCEKKETYLEGFQNFVAEVRKNYPDYTDAQWEKAQATYDKFIDILSNKFAKDLTETDRIQISKLKGSYAALRIKGEALKIENRMVEAEYEEELTPEEKNWILD